MQEGHRVIGLWIVLVYGPYRSNNSFIAAYKKVSPGYITIENGCHQLGWNSFMRTKCLICSKWLGYFPGYLVSFHDNVWLYNIHLQTVIINIWVLEYAMVYKWLASTITWFQSWYCYHKQWFSANGGWCLICTYFFFTEFSSENMYPGSV